MWIKRALVIIPILLFAFLAQSFFWVPGVDSISDNEARQNRIIFYMSGDPKDMNPWSSTTTTDSRIYEYIFDGLLDADKDFNVVPKMSSYAAIHDRITAPVPRGMTEQQFIAVLKKRYGGSLNVEHKTDAGTAPVRVDVATGDVVSGDPSEGQKVLEYTPPAMVTFIVRAEVKQESITSAINSAFGEEWYGKDGRKQFSLLGAATEADLTDEALERVKKGVKEFRDVDHRPIVEMKVRPDIWWTDGPFFSDPDKTWQVTLNGEEAGTVVADSETAAIEQVRQRHGAGDKAVLTAKLYEHRFGDGPEGPWWGRGPQFTARDAKLTYDYLRNPDFGSPRLSSWQDIAEVRVPKSDPLLIEVEYSKLYSPALMNLTGAVIPYHQWNLTAWKEEAIRKGRGPEDLGIADEDYNVMRILPASERDFRHKPAATGSMVLQPLNGDARPLWKISEVVTLRRNEFHWERKPEYQFVDYRVFDPALGRETAEIAFIGGDMDIYEARDFQVERYSQMEDKYYVLKRETTQYEYLGFNCRTGPLASKKVRLALAMAINVSDIMKYVIYEQGQRISGPAYPVLPWYNRDYQLEYKWRTGEKAGQTEKLEFIPYDIKEAEALLKEEGFEKDSSGTLIKDGKPFRIRLVNSSGQGTRNDIALLARQNWQKLGVRIEYEQYEWNVFIGQYVFPGNFDVVVLGWSGGLSFDKRQLFHSAYTPPRGLNFGGFKNEEADRLMEQILKEYDPEQQAKLSHQIYNYIADDVAYVFLFSPYSTAVMDRRIVWRKEVGTDKQGNPIYENRPVNHEYITSAKQPLKFFVDELKRLEERPDFTEEDRKR